ncbi:MAG: Na/Pi cotransporter family protein [Crocinitomicaceae bacterium]|nr:Na/Pi cotransporter family protein [Crocinitomicaceae bacterium]
MRKLLLILSLFLCFFGNSQEFLLTNEGDTIDDKSILLTKAKAKVDEVKIQWAIDPIDYNSIKNDAGKNYSFSIRYATKNELKSIELQIEGAEWHTVQDIPISESDYKIEELSENDSYVFQLGLSNGTETVWAKKDKFSTDRGWGVIKVLILIGALAFFIYGMKIMSEGIQKAAGQKMRNILSAMTSNRLKGIFTGFLTTTLIQSSSATTVMVVSFVNAGLLTLRQSIGVIMGANIGTTVTSWLIVLFGFGSFKVSAFSLPIIAVAIPLLFSSKSKNKSWGEVLIGFAILFMGLQFLKESVPDLKSNPEALQFINDIAGTGIHHILLAVLIGTIITVIVQSSSAAMAITLILCNEGYIPFEMAAGMVLGENIGTTITANLAAIIGNTAAKRAARAHFIFNVFGVVWMVLVFAWFIQGIDYFMINYTHWSSPFTEASSRPVGLSIFHTAFNLLNVLIMVWMVPIIARIVERMVPSKAGDDEFHLEYIRGGVLATPELSILEARKEVHKFSGIASRMSEFFKSLLTETNKKKIKKLVERIEKYEEITDRVEEEIADYLSKVAEGDLSDVTSKRVRAMLSITNDLESIGDIYYQLSKTMERKDAEKIWFTPEQRNRVLEMVDLVDQAFDLMNNELDQEYDKIELDAAIEMENRINLKRDELRSQHLANVEKKEYNVKSGMIYNDIFNSLERVGDHIHNVIAAASGKV